MTRSTDSTERAMGSAMGSPAARLLAAGLRGYQAQLSPVFGALGSRCRFEPSCSQYALDAVEARGALRGALLGLWRLLRCNPLNSGGYDPVKQSAGGDGRRRGMRRLA